MHHSGKALGKILAECVQIAVNRNRLRNLQQGLVPLRESFTGRCRILIHRRAVWRIKQSRLKRVWRMLKKPASIVLTSFRSSTYP